MPRAVISRARRSKPEVEKEFSKVVDEAAEQKENTDSKTQELARLRQAEIQQAVEGISVEGVVQNLSNLVLDYQSQKQTLETEISAQREAWSAEELQRVREQKEYEENLKKQRQREVE